MNRDLALYVLKKSNKHRIFNYENVIRRNKEYNYQIVTQQAKYSTRMLMEVFTEDDIPEYQRRLVWDIKKQSKLIESLIINIPIPPIFLYESNLEKYEIMDGQQRIFTIISFLNNEFELTNLTIWEELNGKNFESLPLSVKHSIHNRYISAIIMLKDSSHDKLEEQALKQLIFERLNTGGTELNNQEIRNSLYQSEFNTRLFTISGNRLFGKLFYFSDSSISRMYDVELILRFFSYISAVHLSISGTTKNILDSYAKNAMHFSTYECDELQEIFEDTIALTYKLFGETAFQSTENGRSEKMIFDTAMLFAYFYRNQILEKYENTEKCILKNSKFELIKDNKNLFNGKYTSIKFVKNRIDLFRDSFL